MRATRCIGLERVTPVSDALQKAKRETPLSTTQPLTEEMQDQKEPSPSGAASRKSRHCLRRLPPAQARAVLASFARIPRTASLPERRHFLDQYVPVDDVAFKVVGTGSVGLRDYLVYLEGNGENDPLFLQIKEEPGSAYAPYLTDPWCGAPTRRHIRDSVWRRASMPCKWQSDPFLGWTTIANRDYLVRQLNDHKASVDLEALQRGGLAEYAAVCGELLARGHARSGDVHLITGYLGEGSRQDKFDRALAAFAEAYADQTEADWHALVTSRKHSSPKPKTAAESRRKMRK